MSTPTTSQYQFKRKLMYVHDNKSTLLLFVILFFISCFYILQLGLGIRSLTYFSFVVVNSCICIANIVNIKKKPYSIKMFVNIFIYFFFILSNAIQFAHNSNHLTFFLQFTEQDYIIFQFIVSIILVLYNVTYDFTPSSKQQKVEAYNLSERKTIVLSSLATICILIHFNFNPFELFARGLADEMMKEKGIARESFSSTSFLIFNYIIRPIPWSCYIIALIYQLKKKYLIILLIFTFITVCPTGIARNAAAMYWLPVFIILCKRWIKGHRIIFVTFVGLLVIFPLLDNFRYFSGKISFNFGLDYLDSMNFDASQIYMAVIKTDTISWGKQLIGVVLFFVPRSIWLDKPLGSGHFLVTQNNGFFTNVSMPFFAEGYINFGYLGILLFTFFFAIFSKKLDYNYWSNFSTRTWRHGIYLLILSASIFIMRGDLLSSFAYTFGIFCTYSMTSKLIRI